ncbi:MAG: hypothetical protein RR696_15175, partial [Clostridia bacterium]
MGKKIAIEGFEDGWIKRLNCVGAEKLGSYKNFSSKAIDLFERYGFVSESMTLADKVKKEIARIQLLIEQEALINSCETYILSSQIRQGMTQKNLSAFVEQGNDFIKEFSKFDYEAEP